jgi:hypothetical protein
VVWCLGARRRQFGHGNELRQVGGPFYRLGEETRGQEASGGGVCLQWWLVVVRNKIIGFGRRIDAVRGNRWKRKSPGRGLILRRTRGSGGSREGWQRHFVVRGKRRWDDGLANGSKG